MQPHNNQEPSTLAANNSQRPLIIKILIISISTLIISYTLCYIGLYEQGNYRLIELFGSHPFYMSALEAQRDFLSAGQSCLISLLLSPTLTAILLLEPHRLQRALIITLSVIALILAMICGIIWGGLLNLLTPIISLLLLYTQVELSPYVETALRRNAKNHHKQ